MERSEHRIEIEAPRERVFAWLVEPELMLRWIGGLREFHPLDPEPGVGARSRQVVDVAGRRMDVESRITAFEPGRLVAAELDGKGFHVDTRHELEDDGDGTLVRSLAGAPVVVCGHGGLETALGYDVPWKKGAVLVLDDALQIVDRLRA